MTTQQHRPASGLDELVRAVVEEISRLAGDGRERAGYGSGPYAEGVQDRWDTAAGVQPGAPAAALLVQRSGVYVRTDLPVVPTPDHDGMQVVQDVPTMPGMLAPEVRPTGAARPAGALPDENAIAVEQPQAGQPQAETIPPGAALGLFEELRVDVDGQAPTMTVSGRIWRLITGGLTWMAKVTKQPDGSYTGAISYRDGNASLRPASSIRVQLTGSPPLQPLAARVTFSRPGAADLVLGYTFARSAFREVGIEFDRVEGAEQTDAYALHDHPVRPDGLPDITLTVEGAFTRQGIKVTRTGGGNVIPRSASVDDKWSDIEMHDAMQQHWSEWRPGPGGQGVAQWQVWTLFAGLHEPGEDFTPHSLGGIMFDDIGTAQRQGCAIFSDSFISDLPPNDPAPEAFARRMRFWTAVHEIGHCFNLAHAWQKSRGTAWIPLLDEPESRSFMNYPFRVPGGPQAFFSDFRYFFSENELRFLRHAPERFVQMGNIPWFDHHAFEQVRQYSAPSPLTLSLRVSRNRDHEGAYRYGMLEPVIGELKLANTSTDPVMVDRNKLMGDDLGIVIQREGETEARMHRPYLKYCMRPEPVVLQPGEALYGQIVLSSGLGGWQIAEPGRYRVYAALRTAAGGSAASVAGASDGQVMAAPLMLRVERPASREQERLADDVCTDAVGRVLALGGSRVLHGANDVMREVVERIPDEAVAKHAAACLALAETVPGKVMQGGGDGRSPRLEVTTADLESGRQRAEQAYGDLNAAAETFGHIRLARNIEHIARSLDQQGKGETATQLVSGLAQTLESRRVKPGVVQRARKLEQQLSGGGE
ncbi:MULTISPECIES: hypothetical protein [unclassified Streptomyces]|uniref:hypothetical protein n=1 Tax=unclassified Streptomyces TaxID=2593676 RepID=UPI00236586FE|nr:MULTISPECIES: hypothetical protein [unclassified Streptomyces]MDF3144739.1 hypothetical protein [Streptomyces sp. T21Q-yed]WDF35694.1 hypothetical protein PBV52_02180 [Streptomyces sp. T12]